MYDNCFPIKSKSVRTRRKDKPWFTKEIRKLSSNKFHLYRQYLKDPTDYKESIYKKCRNKVNNLVKTAKRVFYRNRFKDATGNMKKTWDTINTALCKQKKKKVINYFQCNNGGKNDKKEICEVFNDFLYKYRL